MAVTLKDVARLAGVSASTVSRALSNPELVNEGTRLKVHEAVARLDYQPNRAARGLITGRTGSLGVVVPDLANPVFPGMVKGIQARAREADRAVFLVDTDEDVEHEARLVRALSRQVDGAVLCAPRMPGEQLAALAEELPLVLVNRLAEGVPSVCFDDREGSEQAVTHLHALGHRRLAWVGGPEYSSSHAVRSAAVAEVSAGLGLELVWLGSFAPQFDSGVLAGDLAIAAGVTAVIAYNDVVALGVISRLAARGIDVPGEVSVIGYDDIPFAAISRPPLTTVRLPADRAGRTAVDLLTATLGPAAGAGAGPWQSSGNRLLPVQLIPRGTTAAPPRQPVQRAASRREEPRREQSRGERSRR